MDWLGDVLALLNPRSYITAGFDAGGDWALELDDLTGRIKCSAVVKGSCWLTMAGAGPVFVPEHACFVLPTGRTAVIGSAPDVEPARASAVLDRTAAARSSPIRVEATSTWSAVASRPAAHTSNCSCGTCRR